MSAIKSVISSLCRGLKLFCDVDITAENIRQAKFNQASDKTVEILWEVLYRLCHQLMQEGCNAYAVESLEEQVIFVKLILAGWGYQRTKFYHLPANGQDGSQELLIALAWLLAKQNIFEQLIRYKILQFQEELKKHKNYQTTKPCCIEQSKSIKFEDTLNKMMLLCGKLKNNLNNMHRLRQQNISLLNKIHHETQGLPGLNCLSVQEASLFFEESDGPLKSVKELQDMINTNQRWEKESHLFWKWMDTVLVEASLNSSSSEQTCNQRSLASFLQVIITKLNARTTSEEASGTANISLVPSLSSTHAEENKALQLKVFKKLLSDQLSSTKSACEEAKVTLQRQIKCIAQNSTNTVIFM